MNHFAADAADALSATCETFPLTTAQRDIWLDQLSQGDSPLYNIGGYVELSGAIDPALMQATVECLVAANDALRTVLLPGAGADGLPLQTFVASLPAPLPLFDFSAHADPQSAAQALVEAQMQEACVLDGRPLLRFGLIRLDQRRYWFTAQAHHLIIDGWGFGLLFKSAGEIYSALSAGQQPVLSAPAFAGFIDEDGQYHGSPRYLNAQAYWQEKYRSVPEPLLTARYRETIAPPTPAHVVAFPAALHERMKDVSRTLGGSAFHVLLAALHVYFSRTAQRDEWVVGLPILNRSGARFKATLGLFTQVSAVLMHFGRSLSFAELIKAIGGELKQDFRHQRFPLSEMNRALGLLAEGRSQLFEVSLSYEQDDHKYLYAEAPGHVVKVSNRHEATPLAIHLRSNRFNDKAWLHLLYGATYFDAAEVAALAECLLLILQQGLENLDRSVGDFCLNTPAESAQLQQWNNTRTDYAQGLTIHQRFAARAAEQPDAVAAVCQGRQLTYAELNREANSLAHLLIGLGVRPDDRVAIVARRGLDTLVGLLAILKAGAAYVPIDPAHPAERLSYLLSDSAPVALLTQSDLRERLPEYQVPIIELDRRLWPVNSVNPQVANLTCEHLAYVIYTSGSTGQPKGVMVEHRTLSNLVDWHREAFDLDADSHTSSLAGFGFDAMAWEVWPALCAGATLHLAPANDGSEDIDALLEWWRAQPLDVSFLPTPIAEYAFSRHTEHPTLRTLLIGGDRLRQFNRAQSFEVINNYGPTEATVVASSGRIEPGAPLHIGKPVSNATLYVLDEQQQALPIGVPGELYIGGAGVARGYLNRPELTAERFLDDPFSHQPNARMYRSGDLVRWRADGNLEYLGRNDDQVKLRGVRIEPGEIEAAIARHDAVQEAVVMVRDGQLQAWFTERQALDITQLHEYLKTRLPSALLPSAYVRIPALPLTANGKLDRQALPAPGPDALIRRAHAAPEGPVETALAEIWARVLGIEQVGRHDNFFELGGHSLLAVSLVARMRQAGLHVDAGTLFSQPTLAALAAQTTAQAQQVEIPQTTIPTLKRKRRL